MYEISGIPIPEGSLANSYNNTVEIFMMKAVIDSNFVLKFT